jgi:hypothetical protein
MATAISELMRKNPASAIVSIIPAMKSRSVTFVVSAIRAREAATTHQMRGTRKNQSP